MGEPPTEAERQFDNMDLDQLREFITGDRHAPHGSMTRKVLVRMAAGHKKGRLMSLLTVVKMFARACRVTYPTSVFRHRQQQVDEEMLAVANEQAQRIAYDHRDWTSCASWRSRHDAVWVPPSLTTAVLTGTTAFRVARHWPAADLGCGCPPRRGSRAFIPTPTVAAPPHQQLDRSWGEGRCLAARYTSSR